MLPAKAKVPLPLTVPLLAKLPVKLRVPERVNAAPVFMVRFLAFAVPVISGLCAVAAITTTSVATGTVPALQLPASVQSVEPPSQVFTHCCTVTVVTVEAKLEHVPVMVCTE